MSEEKKIATSGFMQHVPDSTVVDPEHIVNVIKNGLLHECLGEEWRKAAVSTIENLVANGSAKAMSKEEVQELTDSINRAEVALINPPEVRDEILRPKKDITIERPDGVVPGLLDVNVTLCHLFGVVVALVLDDGKLKGMEVRKAMFKGNEIIVGEKVCECPAGAHYGHFEDPTYCVNCGGHCLDFNTYRKTHVEKHFRGY